MKLSLTVTELKLSSLKGLSGLEEKSPECFITTKRELDGSNDITAQSNMQVKPGFPCRERRALRV